VCDCLLQQRDAVGERAERVEVVAARCRLIKPARRIQVLESTCEGPGSIPKVWLR
jgi:hypothetical protein